MSMDPSQIIDRFGRVTPLYTGPFRQTSTPALLLNQAHTSGSEASPPPMSIRPGPPTPPSSLPPPPPILTNPVLPLRALPAPTLIVREYLLIDPHQYQPPHPLPHPDPHAHPQLLPRPIGRQVIIPGHYNHTHTHNQTPSLPVPRIVSSATGRSYPNAGVDNHTRTGTVTATATTTPIRRTEVPPSLSPYLYANEAQEEAAGSGTVDDPFTVDEDDRSAHSTYIYLRDTHVSHNSLDPPQSRTRTQVAVNEKRASVDEQALHLHHNYHTAPTTRIMSSSDLLRVVARQGSGMHIPQDVDIVSEKSLQPPSHNEQTHESMYDDSDVDFNRGDIPPDSDPLGSPMKISHDITVVPGADSAHSESSSTTCSAAAPRSELPDSSPASQHIEIGSPMKDTHQIPVQDTSDSDNMIAHAPRLNVSNNSDQAESSNTGSSRSTTSSTSTHTDTERTERQSVTCLLEHPTSPDSICGHKCSSPKVLSLHLRLALSAGGHGIPSIKTGMGPPTPTPYSSSLGAGGMIDAGVNGENTAKPPLQQARRRYKCTWGGRQCTQGPQAAAGTLGLGGGNFHRHILEVHLGVPRPEREERRTLSRSRIASERTADSEALHKPSVEFDPALVDVRDYDGLLVMKRADLFTLCRFHGAEIGRTKADCIKRLREKLNIQ